MPAVAAGDHFGWHASTGPDLDKRDGHVFVNNLLVGERDVARPLLFVWQPASMCAQLPNSQLTQLDHNVYVRGAERTLSPDTLEPGATGGVSGRVFVPEDLRKLYPEFSINSRWFSDYAGPLFKSPELRNYQIGAAFPGSKAGKQSPPEIGRLLVSQ